MGGAGWMLRGVKLSATGAAILVLAFAFRPLRAGEVVTAESRGYELVWSDEFDGSEIDAAKWHTDFASKVHPPGTNHEQQIYAPANAMVRGGQLALRAERVARGGFPFTSGMVDSHEKFSQRHGWFEARMQLPAGKGMWPAFWLLPVTYQWPPEIDIMEHKGRIADRIWMTLHLPQPGTWRPQSTGREYAGPDFTAGMHTFAVEWKPDALRWYVDGVQRFETRQPTPDVAMYVILNLAVGGDWDGAPDAATVFPAALLVDWVRVYRLPNGVSGSSSSS